MKNLFLAFQEKTLPFPDITVCNLNSIATHPKDRPVYEKYLQDVMKVDLITSVKTFFVPPT